MSRPTTRAARKIQFIRIDTYHALAIAALDRGDQAEYERLSDLIDILEAAWLHPGEPQNYRCTKRFTAGPLAGLQIVERYLHWFTPPQIGEVSFPIGGGTYEIVRVQLVK